jgi:DNA-binding CsgD family transcriptional regulator
MVELGRRLQSTDLEAEALQTLGRVLIDRGETARGLAHLDEAMLFAIENRLRHYSTGKVYCSLIGACEELGDYARASEWTEATARWTGGQPFAVFPGICRVHRATALNWRGELLDAEREAERACTELITIHVPNAGAAFAETGDIRRRLGDLAGAEAAFTRAEELCGRACAGSALLRLAQGRVEAALDVIGGCLDGAGPHRLGRAKILPAHVQIAIAAGALDAARASVEELEAISADYATDVLLASAATARGRLLLAEHDARSACASLRTALERWQSLEVPYEIATTRTLLGQSLKELGDDDGAAGSFAAAEALFEQIGARIDVRAPGDSLGGERAAAAPAGLTARELEVLGLVAAGHTNKQIAAELFLSEKTVSRHLSNIFAKIDVTSRSAATAFAFEQGLVTGRR